MTASLVKTIADFNTTLSLKVAVGDTTATLVSATDDDGVALPTGTYALTIDRSNTSKEYIQCTLTGTSLTNIKTLARGTGVATTGFAISHRKGADVIISDFVVIKRLTNLLDGTTGLDSTVPLKYDSDPTLTLDAQIATKKYVDSVAIAGGTDASSTVKGISKLSLDPVAPTSPIAVGDNDTRVPTQGENDALVGNNTDIAVGTGNKFVTQTGLQHGAETYAADSGANDTYVITLSPVPTSYTNGMVIRFKANTANTGAATLNVNSLGAKTIVKYVSTTLADNDIAAGMFCTLIYDGTNFVLQNPIANIVTSGVTLFKNGSTTKNAADASTTQNIAHGLGIIPKKVKITAVFTGATGQDLGTSFTVYNGTTQSSVSIYNTLNNKAMSTSFDIGAGSSSVPDLTRGVVTFDATNIIITWTKTNNPTGTYNLLWEAEA